MENISKFILEQISNKNLSQKDAVVLLKELQNKDSKNKDDIAIIGMSCKLPKANSVREYWENILGGKECLTTLPEDRKKYYSPLSENPYYSEFLGMSPVKDDDLQERHEARAGYINDIDKFDANFFNIPPREAKYMDPMQRIFLETAWGAIEDSGYGINNIKGTNTGVYIGRDYTSGTLYKYITEANPMHLTGTWEGILASRISYIYNLRGPAMVIDTACSSGNVAIHNACLALRNNNCDMAIAGGISLGTSGGGKSDDPDESDALTTVSSNDSVVRTFDKKSSGTVFGEGVVAFLLKPLKKAIEDGDNVHAVIKGSAINNDGASNGITAPNPVAQENVILDAWKDAGIDPNTISYIEAHGTGTLLGDPIEVKAITSAFRKYTNRKQFCGLGSVKTSVGHLVGTSGCAGLMKVVLSLKNKTIPASLNFDEPNPHINFCDSPIYIVDKAQEWEKDNNPRRAGISSFGFSGTNCHLIVEEAPEKIDNRKFDDGKLNIFTLSTKTENSLNELVKRYNEFLQNDRDINIKDLCFTANNGRGHYGYRVLIIVEDLEDLKRKISEINLKGLRTYEDSQIYYGLHKVISDKRKNKDYFEISESEKRRITREVNTIVDSINGVEADVYNRQLNKLCNLFISGADVDFDKFYSDNKYKRISLPTYAFEKTVYWGEIKQTKVDSFKKENNNKTEHPLIDKCLVKSIYQDIYVSNFSINKHWVLSDHKIMGNNIIPGTTYIEMAREACSRYFNTDKILIKDLVFLTPLIVKEGQEVETHIILSKENNYVKCTIASKNYSNEFDVENSWILHAECKAAINKDAVLDKVDLESIKNKSDMKVIPVDFTSVSDPNGRIVFGPRWFNVTYVSRGEKEIFVELELPDELAVDLKGYKYHPGMLDNAVNTAVQSFGEGMYLPLSYKKLKIFDRIPKHFFSYIRKKGKDGIELETLTFDITLADEKGNVLAEIEDYTMKRVHKLNDLTVNTNSYYCVEWIPNKSDNFMQTSIEGNILIFADEKGISKDIIDNISTSKNNIITVRFGTEFTKINDNSYIISEKEDDYYHLVKEFIDKKIDKILHLATIEQGDDKTNLNDFKMAENKGVYSLLNLTKALINEKVKGNIDIVLITDYAHEVTKNERTIKPLNAAVLALGKVVVQEYPNLMIRCIDIDENTETEAIVSEIMDSAPAFRVSYRDGMRYLEELRKVNNIEAVRNDTEITDDGVYIITGGTGGLGLEVGKYLAAKNNKVRLGLVNRSKLPDRNTWGELLKKNENKKLCSKLETIIDLENKGTTVSFYSMDICDEDSVNTLITELKAKYGKINGIVHCAGVAGDGFIINKSRSVFDEVVQPKVKGTWILDRATRNENMDFFVLYSSMSTLFGSRGQGDYTTANAFLDSYSYYRNKTGRRTITINWPGWKEVGMAVEYNVSDAVSLFTSLPTVNGIDRLNEILSRDFNNIFAGELNYELLASISDQVPMLMSDQIQQAIDRIKKKNLNNSSEMKDRNSNSNEIIVVGKGEEPYTANEMIVAKIYAAVLDINEVDIYESFNAMGGDSILATEVLKVLNKNYNGILDISDIFSYPMIAEMAEYIDSKLDTANDKLIEVNEKEIIEENNDIDILIGKLEDGDVEIDDILDNLSE
ncbi:SDR family NAD(P)-dependent oxidoreductase [Bacillus thuringiensis]|uniref:type I polyketide synthase n=1 Tax=Bacillus thuringiensis TaxID=1428 RepID=UPI000BF7FDE6|nr:SDR family NAD(P)-dependent oxidoreductase [Bacillus thuringiensis]PFJ51511.1 beta-ketoacyl synthase [Bacillus thuringiensis]PFR39097.1 beta-ketoacyl synthase [Bacillus thuringiensis]PGL28060.1 beta-ketoacyl synthase [Bacillus thuringiensis]